MPNITPTTQAAPSPRYRQLTAMPNAELEQIFRAGTQPVAENLVGYEFRGFNTPFFAPILGIQKFVKGFFKDGNGVEGYNISAQRNEREGPWLHKPSAEHPKRFGFYLVYPVRSAERDNYYPNALLLNYGASPRNAAYRVERVLRDYLVCPDAGNADLMIGKAYLALACMRIPSNFFILEKLRSAPQG